MSTATQQQQNPAKANSTKNRNTEDIIKTVGKFEIHANTVQINNSGSQSVENTYNLSDNVQSAVSS